MPIPNVSLYETLTGRFSNGLAIDQASEHEQLLLSVLGTLQRLFASRQGALAHVPGFGLPDLGRMLDAQPAARQRLCQALSDAVLAAEPRVLNAKATPLAQSIPGQLSLELTLELADGRCQAVSAAFTAHSPVVLAALCDHGMQGPAGRPR
ncbi:MULTISPECIES: type VI secretion system baseplate subunit TssE [unclassified Pseudomonas]|uniref:type VI secretion system baseplate subunit TssE n=1 Tax=unclassified Pseudomonas TaxID=196821 RepID=UPI000BCCEA7F|nr:MULTISPECIES: type VI secretion system baseplate subunit TssE [unclassified Pseudomonas]PVZ19638.1 type VI secretion system protein [Pseudomonas sp. URIL14HWK12:I12]PVZ22777.1 type VI secretion system protein [Pseudomonas sp. URIL14HWK12:I10]PVZ37593.1 type VI secretion system protein [Pseudomonas sp. URIL14HWK12:I11]SNZ15207.1 type VI secretion system protein [Pseudomonas sp. URIL14HWK12:I9]